MPLNQEVIPQGGTFSRDLAKQSPCSAGILPGLCIWKNQCPRYSPALGGTWLQMTGALVRIRVQIIDLKHLEAAL